MERKIKKSQAGIKPKIETSKVANTFHGMKILYTNYLRKNAHVAFNPK